MNETTLQVLQTHTGKLEDQLIEQRQRETGLEKALKLTKINIESLEGQIADLQETLDAK